MYNSFIYSSSDLESIKNQFQEFLNAQSVTDEGRFWLETAKEQINSIIDSYLNQDN